MRSPDAAVDLFADRLLHLFIERRGRGTRLLCKHGLAFLMRNKRSGETKIIARIASATNGRFAMPHGPPRERPDRQCQTAVKLHQIHRLQLTAAAQRLNDAQQRAQRHAQRRRADTAGISRAGSTSRSIVRYRRSNCAILRSSSGNTRVSKAVSTSRSSMIATWRRAASSHSAWVFAARLTPMQV
ncbi:Uncharacterised protein [Klebsiella pneumoniae]|nr:Uncharacterised protein [Klebsiella pneumoniae]